MTTEQSLLDDPAGDYSRPCHANHLEHSHAQKGS